jgi:phage terminase small subunit
MLPQQHGRRRMGLTPKQQAFALAYCRRMNASAAYRAVYAPKRMSPKTINEAACRLRNNSKVAARIEEIARPAAEAVGLNRETVIRMLLDARASARAAGQMSAELRAIELLGKHLGVFRKQANVSDEVKGGLRVIIVPAKREAVTGGSDRSHDF